MMKEILRNGPINGDFQAPSMFRVPALYSPALHRAARGMDNQLLGSFYDSDNDALFEPLLCIASSIVARPGFLSQHALAELHDVAERGMVGFCTIIPSFVGKSSRLSRPQRFVAASRSAGAAGRRAPPERWPMAHTSQAVHGDCLAAFWW